MQMKNATMENSNEFERFISKLKVRIKKNSPSVTYIHIHRQSMLWGRVWSIDFMRGNTFVEHITLQASGLRNVRPLQNNLTVTVLDLHLNWIDDLTPIGTMKNLTNLDLTECGIKDISPLAGLENLEVLSISHNKISVIPPLTGCKSLKFIDIGVNKLVDVSDIDCVGSLRRLDLRHNHIRDVSPLRHLTNLRHLVISTNPVSDISCLKLCGDMRTLELARTHITDLTVIDHLPIVYLDIDDTQISDPYPIFRSTTIEVCSVDGSLISDYENLIDLHEDTNTHNAKYRNVSLFDLIQNPAWKTKSYESVLLRSESLSTF